jgi:hypothetical protein
MIIQDQWRAWSLRKERGMRPMLAQRLFAAGIVAIGAAAILIGTGIYLFGASTVAHFSAGLLGHIGGTGEAVDGFAGPDADNELRFYSVLWIAYGVIAVPAALELPRSLRLARLLLALFFAGGAGRALSISAMGAPHGLFVVLMWIELLAPPALLLLSLPINRRDAR